MYHINEEQVFQLQLRVFTHIASLKRHMRTKHKTFFHKTDKKFKRPKCSLVFTERSNVDRHMKVKH